MAETKTDARIEFRHLSVDDVRASPEAAELLREHYEEVALNKGVMVLEPNWKRYYELEERGLLLTVGAFAVQSDPRVETLVGYSVNFICDHLHYSSLVYAQNDLLFVAREWRRGKVGIRLIQRTESDAIERGARMMLWHAKQGTALDALLPRIGYGVQDVIYSREL